MNFHQFKNSIDFFNDMHEVTANATEMWSKNTTVNLPRIHSKDGIWKLRGLLNNEKEKAVVIVGASPRLSKDIKYLKKLDKHFLIITVNSALKYLLDYNIKPDYVIAIDGSPDTLVRDLDCDNQDLTLITSNATAPEIFDIWKGKVIWTPYYSIDKELKSKVRNRLGRSIPGGGNTFTFAASISYFIFHARMFIFIANECCYDDEYYVNGMSCKWQDEKIIRFNVTDIKGRDRVTNLPLYQYKMWLENMCNELTDCTFIDTSFGIVGTDCEELIHLTITQAIKKIKSAFRKRRQILKEKDWRKRERLRYENAYATGEYIPTIGKDLFYEFVKKFSVDNIDNSLDVGCGIGQGVAILRNNGVKAFGTDIASNIIPYWKKGNITKFCSIACADNLPFQDNYFNFVSCTEVFEHIPEEGVEDVLKELHRVGSHTFLFTIMTREAKFKMPTDGSEPHVCVKPPEWWMNRIYKAGFAVNWTITNPTKTSLIVFLTKALDNDGNKLQSYDMLLQPRKEMYQKEGIIGMDGGLGFS